ncbi:hypothetical protein QTP88_001352 [Uroleucon formosanum]
MNKSSQSNLSSLISTEPKSKKRKIDSLEIISSNNHEEVEGQCNKLEAVKSVSMLDIGKFVNSSISELSIKEQLLNNPWCPPNDYKFPASAGKRNLRFQRHWMDQYSWGFGIKQFFKLEKCVENFSSHSSNLYHKKSVDSAEHFLSVQRGLQSNIVQQIDVGLKKQIEENKKKLHPIVNTIIMMDRQEISFRGTSDFGRLTVSDSEPIINDGNCRAILRMRIKSGDSELKNHIESAPCNALYTSPDIQNKFISIFGNLILEKIVNIINKSKCFSIMADETTDICKIESLCIRYIDISADNCNEFKIREDFLTFVPIIDVTGNGIASSILNSLNSMKINLELLCGQSYNGAAAMSGHLSGVQAKIEEHYPKALYVHFTSSGNNKKLIQEAIDNPSPASHSSDESMIHNPSTSSISAQLTADIDKIKNNYLFDGTFYEFILLLDNGIKKQTFFSIVKATSKKKNEKKKLSHDSLSETFFYYNKDISTLPGFSNKQLKLPYSQQFQPKQNIVNLVFDYIIEEMRPLSTCEKAAFRSLIMGLTGITDVAHLPDSKVMKRELKSSNVEALIDRDFSALLAEEDCYAGKYSGFTLSHIDGLLLGVYEYTPMGGSSYLPLPESILNRKAVVNPQNIDRQCFKEEHRYDFSTLSTPTPVSEIELFERSNPGTTVNLYGVRNFEKNKKSSTQSAAYPLRVADEEKADHFDLLLITGKDGENHYTYISNFSRLASPQKNNHEHRLFFCKRCFTSFEDRPLKYKLHGEQALAKHRLSCGTHKPVLPLMPKEGDTLEFKAWCKTERLPFVIYADFEALLLKTSQKQGANTTAIHTHHPMSYGYLVVAAEGVPIELFDQFNIPRAPVIFRGSAINDEVAKRFVRTILNVTDRIGRLYKEVNVPIIMSVEDCRVHDGKTLCELCSGTFTEQNCKTAHHDHLSGRFLKTLCNTCNLKLKTPNFVPCFLHNLSNYDAHFIVTNLANDDNRRISVIANTEEKYISFSKYINNTFSVRFVDTCRFMASSLACLAENLVSANFDKFREVAKFFTPSEMALVTRKGVYPYEYTDSCDKLSVTSLPDKFQFYSALTETHVCDEDYDHANRVWNHFGCTTLGAYSDLYLKVDVLLSADVFENFRDICMTTYHLDPSHYYTSPGFSFDCMLKLTKVHLELLTDYEKILFLESGTRGGLVQASKRHARANNPETPGYNAEEPNTSLIYLDGDYKI